jgi:soluble lytic murein transglycosylase
MSKRARYLAAVAAVVAALGVYIPLARAGAASESITLDRAELLARHGETHAAWSVTRGVPPGQEALFRMDVRLLTELGRYEEADSLLAHRSPLLVQSDAVRHYLQRARLNYLAGRYDAAADMIAAIDSIDSDVYAGYRDYVGMEIDLALEHPQAAVVRGERALARGMDAALARLVDAALMEAYQRAGRSDDALELSRSLIRSTRSSRERQHLYRVQYELLTAEDRGDAARDAALKVVRIDSRSGDAREVSADVLARNAPGALSSNELLTYAAHLTALGDLPDARRLLRELDRRRLSPSQREEKRLREAEYFYRSGMWSQAAELARPAFRTAAFKRQSILILARCYRHEGRRAESAKLYEYFAKTYPNDGKAAEALFVASRLYERVGYRESQRRVQRILRRSYPSSYYGRLATLGGAWDRMDAGDYSAAATLLAQRVQRSRRTDEAALYYLADTYRATGDVDNRELIMGELRTLDPYSFYLRPGIPRTHRRPMTDAGGRLMLAGPGGLEAFLFDALASKDAAWQRIHDAVAAGTPPSATHEACVERGSWFLEAGFRDWGEGELSAARSTCFESPPAAMELARLYDEYGMPWRSVRLYQHVRDRMHWKSRREYRDDFLWLLYPTPFPVQVLENAMRHNLPPHLVYAMIREESRFDIEAVSRVGALGLMQLMPETGRRVARQMELPEWVEEDLLDPEINVTLGVWYAASLAELSDGNYHWMLAAYNAGPRNARRWFDDAEGESLIRTVDGIDYRETRKYVQRIVESANIYHSLYFSGAR